MSQHHLLSAKFRDLPLRKLGRLSEQECYDIVKQLRWPQTDGEPVCPHCDNSAWTLGDHSLPGDKRQFRCSSKACRKKFSVTSGTLLHSRKLDFSTIVFAVGLFVAGAKGSSSIELGNSCDINNKTAWVLCQKMREAQIKGQLGRQLSGIVEIDGSTYGGHIHQVNERSERFDRRKAANITGKELTVVVARERSTLDRIGLSVCTVVPHESHGRPFVVESVDRFAKVFADDGSHWDALRAAFDVQQVNHSQRYYDKGVCTNQAESYFSRLDRMEMGTHHHIAGDYLWGYACDAVWREDERRKTQMGRFKSILGGLVSNSVSRTMKGYWQRHQLNAKEEMVEVVDASNSQAVDADTDVAIETEAMDQDVADALFGKDALPAQRRHTPSSKWKARPAFVQKRHDFRPKPWSELKQPAGLPSFIP